MRITIKKPIKVKSLRYSRYLPRALKAANPLLGSWVSPKYINFPNGLYRADANTLRGRLRISSKFINTPTLVNTAFKEKWFSWRLVNPRQISVYEKVMDNESYKTLILKFSPDLFKGESASRRYLAMAALIEHFASLYSPRFKIAFTVFNSNKGETTPLYKKYSSLYGNTYFTVGAVGLLGSLSLLDKIYRLSRGK